jgi:hypothetical protein
MTEGIDPAALAMLQPAPSVAETAALSDSVAQAPEQPGAAPAEAAELAGDDPPADTPQPEPPAAHAHAFPVGSAVQQVLDCLLDSDAAELSMNQLKLQLPHILPGTVEQSVRRLANAGRLERTAPGVYKLGTPATAAAEHAEPEPAPAPEPVPAPAPDQARQAAMASAERKHAQRERDRAAVLARQAEADAALRDRLVEAAGNNVQPGLGIDDVSPVHRALALGIPLSTVLSAVSSAHGLQACPANPRAETWRSPDLIRRIARLHARALERQIVAHLEAAKPAPRAASAPDDAEAVQLAPEPETAPAPSPGAPEPVWEFPISLQAAADNLVQNEVIEIESDQDTITKGHDVTDELGEVELDAATDAAPSPSDTDEKDTLDTIETIHSASDTDEKAAVGITDALPRPAVSGRESILRAFKRAVPEPAPKPATERPWFAPGPPKEPPVTDGFVDESWEFFVEGFKTGALPWNTRRLGPRPGEPGCRAPRRVLRSFGL